MSPGMTRTVNVNLGRRRSDLAIISGRRDSNRVKGIERRRYE